MPRILALLALLAWLIILSPYPATVFMGGAAACLSLPVYRWLRARMSRIVAVSVYSTGLCACLLAPFVVVTVLVAPQAVAGVRRLNEWRASGWAISPRLAETFDSVWNWLMKVPGLSDWLTEVSDNLSAIINSSIKTAVSGGLGLAGSTMTAVWLAFLFVVLAGLGVVYAPTLHKLTLRVTQLPEASLNRFILTLRNALRAVFIGLIFVPIIQGTLTGVGLRLVGVSEPAFWGLLAAFAAVIPVVGTALVWAPLALVLWIQGSPGAALGLAAWGSIVVAGSDNLVRPYLLKTGIEAPMFVLLLSILCSMAALGFVGLVAGPVLVALGQRALAESDILKREAERRSQP
ncbi:MAG TPA: AI-2E family transporter [Candidatus Mailhella merdigallinarum]|uniref:AI-2E family transporter n=1 Tax=Candidatus Mailhella merdigallinarum TaxID=2838658 RepID=A0A9D2KKZ3_9BACT|nr:AI-2E family transporter [Desulfovibrionaceae bacterium]PWM66205.1 MAG: AI-2E family transporter [Desulfovibrionaceae bacterium]HJA08685.1 AI-2E family transporter [Candidatus Mailhella merdigallinarum]